MFRVVCGGTEKAFLPAAMHSCSLGLDVRVMCVVLHAVKGKRVWVGVGGGARVASVIDRKDLLLPGPATDEGECIRTCFLSLAQGSRGKGTSSAHKQN